MCTPHTRLDIISVGLNVLDWVVGTEVTKWSRVVWVHESLSLKTVDVLVFMLEAGEVLALGGCLDIQRSSC